MSSSEINFARKPGATIKLAVVLYRKSERVIEIEKIVYDDKAEPAYNSKNTSYPIESYKVLVGVDAAQTLVDLLTEESRYTTRYHSKEGAFSLQSPSSIREEYVTGDGELHYWFGEDGLWNILEWFELNDIIFIGS